MNKTVLVTGGTGFIGSHVIEKLLENKFKVIMLKRSSSDTWRVKNIIDKVTFYDLDKVELDEVFNNENIDSILHLATLYKKFHLSEDIEPLIYSNITFPVNLLETAIKFNVDNFVNTGSFFEYSNQILPITENNPKNPFNLYAMTKISFESILRSYTIENKIKGVTLNIFSPYGPKDNEYKLIPSLINKALVDDEIKLSQGLQKLDFVYVKDIAKAYINCLQNLDSLNNYEAINIANGFPYSVREVVSIMEEILGYNIKKTWGFPAKNDFDIVFSSIDKAYEIIKWKPEYSIHEGLKETINYYREKYDI